MRSRQTKATAAVAYEAGNWGLGFGAEGTQPTGNATSAELAQYDAHYVGGSVREGALSDLRLRI